MKLCLAFAFQNEALWLRLHLPVWLESGAFDGIVALDGGSSDGGANYVRSLGGAVFERPFDWDFSAHMNALIKLCEGLGYDALIRTDPDEVMFPDAVRAARDALLTEFKCLRFPRYTFEGDRCHILPFMYPDYQTRAFHLNRGVQYSGKVHETVEASMGAIGWVERGDNDLTGQRDIMRMPHLHLYHYEGLRTGRTRALKHVNYEKLAHGQPAIEQLPPGYTTNGALRFRVPFVGPQPLDPAVVGMHAPYEGERA